MTYPVSQIANQLLIYSADMGRELMTNMKLQKMLYYQQGFHLAYFNHRIQFRPTSGTFVI